MPVTSNFVWREANNLVRMLVNRGMLAPGFVAPSADILAFLDTPEAYTLMLNTSAPQVDNKTVKILRRDLRMALLA